MRKVLVLAGSALLTGLGLWSCDVENGLVGGECSPGYALVGDRCSPVAVVGPGLRDGASSDGTSNDGALTDATTDRPTEGEGGPSGDAGPTADGSAADADGGLTCIAPLIECSGVCVDPTIDPLNCGTCGNVCPSLLCSNSKCDGAVAGHIVVFGHDYQGAFSSAQRKALANAVLLSATPTIRVRSYEQYANATAVTNVKNIITAAVQAQGRTTAYTVATQPSDVGAGMTVVDTDVLVVYDQVNAPAATLGLLGTGWATALTTFTHNGGIVLVLDGHGGANPQMPALLKNSLLLDVSSDTVVPNGTPLVDIASQDAVGQGLVSPYGAGQNTVHFACNEANAGPVTYVVVDPSADSGSDPPVIVHKVAP